MTQEEKQLLLIDLCARLPYGVIVHNEEGHEGYLNSINQTLFGVELGVNITATRLVDFQLDTCKPYLRPMSSMTDEEIEECYQLQRDTIHVTFYKYDEGYEKTIDLPYFKSLVDFYNSHHLDYCGLIPMGLALEATKDMYKTE